MKRRRTHEGVIQVGQEEKVREAQEVLDWVTMQLRLSVKCRVIDCKHGNYRVQVLKGDRLVMPIEVAEQWVKESKVKGSSISDSLRTLLTNLEHYQ